jgi:hypothetical protein
MEQLSHIFASDHIYVVAFLRCYGHNIVGTTRHGCRVSFEFRETPELNADIARFMSGGVVPARQFSFELLKIKSMLNGGESKMEKVNKNEENKSLCGTASRP